MSQTKVMLFVAVGLVVSGCNGGDDGNGGGGGPSIPFREYGGSIGLEMYLDDGFPEGYLSASLFRSIEGPGSEGRVPLPEIGTCDDDDVSGGGGGGGVPTITYLDVGDSITATGPLFAVTADLFIDGGFQYFDGYVDSAGTGVYSITVAGGADVAASQIATITVPAPTTSTPITSITPGDPLEVAFNAPAGTTHVQIDLSHSEEDLYFTCWVDPAEKSFLVPASITEQLDEDAYVDVYGEAVAVVEIAGKTVVLRGEAIE